MALHHYKQTRDLEQPFCPIRLPSPVYPLPSSLTCTFRNTNFTSAGHGTFKLWICDVPRDMVVLCDVGQRLRPNAVWPTIRSPLDFCVLYARRRTSTHVYVGALTDYAESDSPWPIMSRQSVAPVTISCGSCVQSLDRSQQRQSRRSTVIWATRRLGEKISPKCPFGRHEIGRLGDNDESFGRRK